MFAVPGGIIRVDHLPRYIGATFCFLIFFVFFSLNSWYIYACVCAGNFCAKDSMGGIRTVYAYMRIHIVMDNGLKDGNK